MKSAMFTGMCRGEHSGSDFLIYLLAFSLAAAIMFVPKAARSGGYTAGGPAQQHSGPRWSNREHLDTPNAPTEVSDCGSGHVPSAHYVPGVDAWGRPVPPAEGYRAHPRSPLPVELDVHLKSKKIGKKTVDITSGPVTYDAANNTINGYPLTRDCAPASK